MGFFLVVFVTLFGMRFLFKDALLNTDDMEQHAARTANYYLALKEGQFPPRWAPNLNGGLGYPVFLFIYQLPYALAVFFYILSRQSIQVGVNLSVVIAVLLSSTGMYLFSKARKRTTLESVLVSLLYTFAPYYLINIFVRGAFGEIFFTGLLPWVLLFFELILTSKKILHTVLFQTLLSLSFSLFLLSHQVSMTVAIPVISLYFAIRLFTVKKLFPIIKTITTIFIPLCIGGMMVAWLWIPAFFEKKFTALENHSTVREFWMQFPPLRSLFLQLFPHNKDTSTIDLVTFGLSAFVILFLLVLVFLKKRKQKNRLSVELLFWIGCLIFSVILMLPISRPIWEVFSFLRYMQFPWRMLWLTVFSLIMILIHTFDELKTMKKLYVLGMFLLFATIIHSFVFYVKPRGYISNPDYEWFEYFKTASSYDENQPIWATRYIARYTFEKVSMREHGKKLFPYINGKEDPKEHTVGSVSIDVFTGIRKQYTVTTDVDADIIQKTVYYPGWVVYVDGKKTDIEFNDQEFPGRVVIPVSKGTHKIESYFTNDVLDREIADSITLFGCVSLLVYPLLYVYWKRTYEKNKAHSH